MVSDSHKGRGRENTDRRPEVNQLALGDSAIEQTHAGGFVNVLLGVVCGSIGAVDIVVRSVRERRVDQLFDLIFYHSHDRNRTS
jgi:hypothetical protein